MVYSKCDVNKIMAFEMEKITMGLSNVEVYGVMKMFSQVLAVVMMKPEGEVGLLVGLHKAGLHPQELQCRISIGWYSIINC